MTIEKLPSGSYRIKQMIEGRRYSVTVNHKPSQREALELMSDLLKDSSVEKGSFNSAAFKYIEMKENILSPKTIREYRQTPGRLPEWFQKADVSTMTSNDVQRCVNELSARSGPKTVRNYHGFISAVLGSARPNLILRTTLPKLQKKDPYIPRKEDLKRILEAAENTQYKIPLRLACYGLRRGEICALKLSDLDKNNVIHITKDLVQNSSGKWIVKRPKTPSSVREVPIDAELAAEIRRQGYIFKGHPGTISKFLRRTQDELGLEYFSIHKLRHLFASILLDSGYDLKTIQELGGWNGSETVSRVYLHSLKLRNEEERKKITSNISSFLD